MSRWQKDIWKYCPLWHTCTVIWVTKERTSFCEGVFTVCRPGRKVQRDNESAWRGTEQRGLFLSTLASHLHLQTKHEMTIISKVPDFIPFQQGASRDDSDFFPCITCRWWPTVRIVVQARLTILTVLLGFGINAIRQRRHFAEAFTLYTHTHSSFEDWI